MACLTLALLAAPARGEDTGEVPAGDDTHPVYSADDGWARELLLGAGALFAAAAVVGPLVWWRARDTVPVAATHEEDPAADRH